ncbi:MAG: O-antigen ligase family protein [archaeon]
MILKADKKILGSKLAILTYIILQFVEINFFKIGNIPVSLQKLLAVTIFPVSLILIGRILINKKLFCFMFLLTLAYIFNHIVMFESLVEFSNALMIITMHFFSAVVLYTALSTDKKNLNYFFKMWIVFSLISSFFALLQVVDLSPLSLFRGNPISIGSGFYRGVGFKTDPNFQAFILNIGLVFLLLIKSKHKYFKITLLLLGVLATFSRMGILLSLVSLIMFSYIKNIVLKKDLFISFIKSIVIIIVLIVVCILSFLVIPDNYSSYLLERSYDIVNSFKLFQANELKPGRSSAQDRLILATTSFRVGIDNFLTGVGAFNTEDYIYRYSNIKQAAHNTYLELFATGGIWGLFALLFYFKIVYNSIKNISNSNSYKSVYLLFIFIYGLIAMFLSLTYNSILWLPLVLSLTMKECNKFAFKGKMN